MRGGDQVQPLNVASASGGNKEFGDSLCESPLGLLTLRNRLAHGEPTGPRAIHPPAGCVGYQILLLETAIRVDQILEYLNLLAGLAPKDASVVARAFDYRVSTFIP